MRYGLMAVCIFSAVVTAQGPVQQPGPSVQQVRAEWANCEGRLDEVSKALAIAQPYRTQAVSGAMADAAETRLLAIRQTEDRIITLYAKEHPGKTLDPKTGKVTDAKPTNGGK